jgi:hypothetical protein
MYAQLIQCRTTAERLDELGQVIRRELVSALRVERGFSGALSLLDRASGSALVVVLWETNEDAARLLVDCDASPLSVLAAVTELSVADLCGARVWEVSARG